MVQLFAALALCLLQGSVVGCPLAERRQSANEQQSGKALREEGSRRLQQSCRSKRDFDIVGTYGSLEQAKTCFDAAVSTFQRNWVADIAGPCLRMSFHDAGTYEAAAGGGEQCGGANGSVKNEMDAGADEHNGMQGCYKFLWGRSDLSSEIRAEPGCSAMTDADLVHIVGYVAVVQAGGSPPGGCGFYPGRPDAEGLDNISLLPPTTADDTELVRIFRGYDFGEAQAHFGLTLPETVATLSGAHTIGESRVTDRSPSNIGIGPLTSEPDEFNGSYYAEIADGYKGRAGWFASDRHGVCDTFKNRGEDFFDPEEFLFLTECADERGDFKVYYDRYSQAFLQGDDSLFLSKFCQAYQAMGTIGLNMPDDYADVAAQFMIQ